MQKETQALVEAPVFPVSPVLLVDGDIIAYRAAAAAEKSHYLVVTQAEEGGDLVVYFDNAKDAKAYANPLELDVWNRKEVQPESHAIQCLESTMEAITKRFPDSQINVYLSGERNFRDGIWRTKKYKGNRTSEKPKHLEAVRQALISRWSAVVSENQEADDDIGIASGESTVVVSTDKDLDQIPGWHYNWVNEELYHVSPENAEQFFWEQVISGDMVDNIPGLPGYGPVKARKYLDQHPPEQAGEFVNALFEQEGFDVDYLDEMIQLVRIKRA